IRISRTRVRLDEKELGDVSERRERLQRNGARSIPSLLGVARTGDADARARSVLAEDTAPKLDARRFRHEIRNARWDRLEARAAKVRQAHQRNLEVACARIIVPRDHRAIWE